MDLMFNGLIKYKNKNISMKREGNSLIIKNGSLKHGFYIKPKFYKAKDKYLRIRFLGTVLDGNSAVLSVFNTKKQLIGEITLNGEGIIELPSNVKFLFAIKILANSEVRIDKVEYNFVSDDIEIFDNFSQSDTLVITPSYPSLENKYFGAFVHSRIDAYKKNGLNVDVACCFYYSGIIKYDFEGVNVVKLSFDKLRSLLRVKKYKKILIHFFDYRYAQVLDATDLTETKLYLWVHGPETLYWDWPMFMTRYFEKKYEITEYDKQIFESNDRLIKRYNDKPNVSWIFVSNWIKERSEELINIKFNNYYVIPNLVDETNFKFTQKNPELRKKIFFLRRFDNVDKYAIDVNVRTIIELSKRPFFEDLEFNIYGIGNFYNELVSPLKKFKNVNLYPKFLSHTEIAKIHQENGIALFATRYDSQGVSMCEAAMSGLAVVSSDNAAIKEFLPYEMGILAPTEDYVAYADIIERMYYNPKEFCEVSNACYNKVYSKCSFNETIMKEIELFKSNDNEIEFNKVVQTKPILSIIIPSYNVAKYLASTVSSLVNQENADKLEILIINDGSKDNTKEVAQSLINKFTSAKKPIIKLVDKENGGHGSTINVGLKKATGKYVRIIDGDDWVNSEDLKKLIDKLAEEDSDIVVTNYCEDHAVDNVLIFKRLYDFMIPGKKYEFDDLCDIYYGFREWGPILATANFKTEMLKQFDFKLTEKSFYVDMEFNAYSIIPAKSIVYYDLDIYRYFLGRVDQSISQASFVRNRFQHENVLLNIISIVNSFDISEEKKDYINRLLIIPMIKSHYIIVSDYSRSGKEFRKFDRILKKYPRYYYDSNITTKFVVFNRKTKGLFVNISPLLKKIYNIIRRIK